MAGWGWPQWVYAALMVFSVLVNVSKHGQSRAYDGPAAGLAAMIGAWLLWMGGFWS
jgi:hypothetical protein